MTIQFKAKDKTLASYTEMAVNFGTGEKGDLFTEVAGFEQAIRGKISSSSDIEYDNQEKAWKQIADNYGYDGLKEMAAAIVKLYKGNGESTSGYNDIMFEGLEGLAVLTGNKDLMEVSDYGLVGNSDQLITSMFYGGARMKNWKRNVKEFITPKTFIQEIKNMDDYGITEIYGISQVEVMANNIVKVHFGNGPGRMGDSNQDEMNNSAKTQKEVFHKALEEGDELFDFNIAEEFESNVWTIMVK